MHKCNKCEKQFDNYRALNGHMRMHGRSNGSYVVSRKKKNYGKCLYCATPLLKLSNKFCNTDCFHNYQWEYVNKPKVLAGYGSIKTQKRYLKEKYGEICDECGQKNIWNNKNLVLQLDHKDGNSDNNQINNLRLLCPNCHTQTETYGAKG